MSASPIDSADVEIQNAERRGGSPAAAGPAQEESSAVKALRLLPGLILLAAVGYAGKLIEASLKSYGTTHHLKHMPNIEYVLCDGYGCLCL